MFFYLVDVAKPAKTVLLDEMADRTGIFAKRISIELMLLSTQHASCRVGFEAVEFGFVGFPE